MIENVVEVAERIEAKITESEETRANIDELAREKSLSEAQYERALAIVIISLKNGKSFKLGDETVLNPPATYMKEIAKAICSKEKILRDQKEAEYKTNQVKLNCIEFELNGWQSIYRHLSAK